MSNLYNCRFCLKSPESFPFKLLSTVNSAYISLILPEIDLTLIDEPKVCHDCLDSLENAYTFKKKCLETESQIKIITESKLKEEIEVDQVDSNESCNDSEIDEFVEPSENKNEPKRVYKITFICEICKEGFKTMSLLNEHKEYHVNYTCATCNEEFPSKYLRQKHIIKNHKDDQEFPIYFCPLCDEEFLEYCDVFTHRNKSHSSKINTYTGKIACKLKDEDHTASKMGLILQYACDLCDETFNNTNRVFVHKRAKHAHLRPFGCPHCELKFSFKSIFSRHLETIHFTDRLKKRFVCSFCEKAFIDESKLKQHVRWHTNEKPLLCSECGKRFTTMPALTRHQRIHSDTKHTICEICGKGFYQYGNYKIHMKVHNKKQ